MAVRPIRWCAAISTFSSAPRATRSTACELSRQLTLPFFDLGQAVFRGFQDLLDARIPKERQKAALTRLHRYVGAEKGYEPITVLARARYEEQAGNAQLIGPWIVEAQQYLDNQPRYLDGIQKLLRGQRAEGLAEGHAGAAHAVRRVRQVGERDGAAARTQDEPVARRSCTRTT